MWMVWGEDQDRFLQRSVESVEQTNPGIGKHIVHIDGGSSLNEKSRMADFTKFDTTLFLDADTVVFGDLTYGFEKAERFGLALCINECPWACRYKYAGRFGENSIEYNTGVMFFTAASRRVFTTWATLAGTFDSRMEWERDGQQFVMLENDQAAFAASIEETGYNPFVLSTNWNVRPVWQKSLFGPPVVWHDRSQPPERLLSRPKTDCTVLLDASRNPDKPHNVAAAG